VPSNQLPTARDVAYYTVVNAAHYPGVVALLNSLRFIGETAPLVVVDCGLTPQQRAALSEHCVLVAPMEGTHPGLQKATGPLVQPAEIMVVIDADVIVNRSLSPLFDDARDGKIVTFRESIIEDRFFAEWAELGIGELTRSPYVTAGHFVLSGGIAAEFLPLFGSLQDACDVSSGVYSSGNRTDPEADPYFYADQDVFNAVLCARFDGRVVRLEQSLWSYPPFDGLTRSGREGLGCAYSDGTAPYVLHHFWKKPWLSPVAPNLYSELFTELVTDAAAPIRLGRGDIPLRLRASRLAPLDRWRASVQRSARARLRGKLGLRPALEREVRRAGERLRRANQ
jgi:hypothetical protein